MAIPGNVHVGLQKRGPVSRCAGCLERGPSDIDKGVRSSGLLELPSSGLNILAAD
jgi:hypothetical protein